MSGRKRIEEKIVHTVFTQHLLSLGHTEFLFVLPKQTNLQLRQEYFKYVSEHFPGQESSSPTDPYFLVTTLNPTRPL